MAAGRPAIDRRRLTGWIGPGMVLACLLAAAGAARAQPKQAAAPADDEEEPIAQDSPRASVGQYLELSRAGRYDEAAIYLDLRTAAQKANGAELARRLTGVLDRHVWIDLDALSPLATGRADDGLPRGTDEIARIPGPTGKPEPVRIVHRRFGPTSRWIFSRATVSRIDAWYERLENRWALDNLPEVLLRTGPLGLLYWQWLALPALILIAWLGGLLLSRLTRRILTRFATRTATRWDDEVLARGGPPLTLAWAVALAYFLVPRLALYQPAREFVDQLLRAAFLIACFWALTRAIDVVRQFIGGSPWAVHHPASRSLLPLGARVAKVLILALAVVALLSEFGYPVASLVAGLGIGGLAVALGAQKSFENLFGAFAIGGDQPFREGDFVKVEDFVATVEVIGLRSTRFRTLDRTLITVPNGKLAEMRLESFTVRDRMRLFTKIRLAYQTTEHQTRAVLDGVERVLREHPKLWPDALTVRLVELGESTLDIDVMAWFQTPDWDEFQLIRQEVLLQFMGVIEAAGTSVAVPARAIWLRGESDERARPGGPVT
jgi:MscS family membrane protein